MVKKKTELEVDVKTLGTSSAIKKLAELRSEMEKLGSISGGPSPTEIKGSLSNFSSSLDKISELINSNVDGSEEIADAVSELSKNVAKMSTPSLGTTQLPSSVDSGQNKSSFDSNAIVQGIVQGLTGVDFIQRGPGAVAQGSAASLARGAKEAAFTPFSGMQGFSSAMGNLPVIGAAVQSMMQTAVDSASAGLQLESADIRLGGGQREIGRGSLRGLSRMGVDITEAVGKIEQLGLRRDDGTLSENAQEARTSIAADQMGIGSLSSFGDIIRGLEGSGGLRGSKTVEGILEQARASELSGREQTDLLSIIAEAQRSFTQTGIPLNTNSITNLVRGFDSLGIAGGERGLELARQFSGLNSQIAGQGPQNFLENRLMQIQTGIKPGEQLDYTSFLEARANLSETALTSESLMTVFRDMMGVAPTGAQSVSSEGLAMLESQLQQSGINLSPQNLLDIKSAVENNDSSRLDPSMVQGAKSTEQLLRETINKFGVDLKSQATLATNTAQLGKQMAGVVLKFDKTRNDLATAFVGDGSTLNLVADGISSLGDIVADGMRSMGSLIENVELIAKYLAPKAKNQVVAPTPSGASVADFLTGRYDGQYRN